MLSDLVHEPHDSLEREHSASRSQAFGPQRRPERARGEPLHVWSVGFSGAAAEHVQRSGDRVGRQVQRFGDCWRLAQYVMPCFSGSLVRRPDLVLVNADHVNLHDLDWLHDIGGDLPIWRLSSAEVLAENEARFARRLRAAAHTFAEETAAVWP